MALFSKKRTVYYPGSTLTKYFPNLVLNWKSILSDFGIQFDVEERLSSGWSLWNQGYQQEFEEHKKYIQAFIERQNITTIITSSPEATFMFSEFYDVEVKHVTEVVYDNLRKVQQFNTGFASFHDNTTQVRRNNIISEPREILKKAGFSLIEFTESKKRTQCLGTSTGLINNSPRLAAKLALRRQRQCPTGLIITDSPEDYLHLKRNTTVNVAELSEVLVEI